MKIMNATNPYNISKENRILYRDIELNSGPVINYSTLSKSIADPQSDVVSDYRLLRHGLRPLDVGGRVDCFFMSLSHQP